MDGKCDRCGSMMWSIASAKFLDSQDFRKKLADRFGDYDRYFDREFDQTRVLSIPDFGEMLQALSDFLRGRDMGKVVFMPRGWWIRCEHFFEFGEEELAGFVKETSPVKFGSAEDAVKFLQANMLYGTAYDYYAIDEGLEWAVTICNDMEIHFAGSKQFFDSFTDYGDAEIPEEPPVTEAAEPQKAEKGHAQEAGPAQKAGAEGRKSPQKPARAGKP